MCMRVFVSFFLSLSLSLSLFALYPLPSTLNTADPIGSARTRLATVSALRSVTAILSTAFPSFSPFFAFFAFPKTTHGGLHEKRGVPSGTAVESWDAMGRRSSTRGVWSFITANRALKEKKRVENIKYR